MPRDAPRPSDVRDGRRLARGWIGDGRPNWTPSAEAGMTPRRLRAPTWKDRRLPARRLRSTGVPFGREGNNIDVRRHADHGPACPAFSRVRGQRFGAQRRAVVLQGRRDLPRQDQSRSSFARTGLFRGRGSPMGACSSIRQPAPYLGGSSSGSGRGGGRGATYPFHARHRYRGIRPHTGRLQRRGRHQADGFGRVVRTRGSGARNCPDASDCVSIFALTVGRRTACAYSTPVDGLPTGTIPSRALPPVDTKAIAAVPLRRASPARIANGTACRNAAALYDAGLRADGLGLGGNPPWRSISRRSRRPAGCYSTVPRIRRSGAQRFAPFAMTNRDAAPRREPGPCCRDGRDRYDAEAAFAGIHELAGCEPQWSSKQFAAINPFLHGADGNRRPFTIAEMTAESHPASTTSSVTIRISQISSISVPSRFPNGRLGCGVADGPSPLLAPAWAD